MTCRRWRNGLGGCAKRMGRRSSCGPATKRGPCGFGIERRFQQPGIECAVVAPSLIPRRASERVKTDRRDARKPARLRRAGELRAVYIPVPTDEAMRGLCQARSDAADDRSRARHRLKAFLLRHGYRYQGKSSWSAAHERYLRELVLSHPAMKVILGRVSDHGRCGGGARRKATLKNGPGSAIPATTTNGHPSAPCPRGLSGRRRRAAW